MRVRWRNFSKGLFAGGSREAVPEGFARRLVGFSHMLNDYVRTRFRHEGRLVTEASRAVHSIFRTGNSIFYGADRGYGTGTPGTAGGAADTGTAIYTHANNVLLGTDTNNIIRRLAFFSGRSVAGKGTQDEFVYVAGGGQLFKHKKTAKVASDLSRWGIPAPTAVLKGTQRGPEEGTNYFYPLEFKSSENWQPTNISGSLSFPNDALEPGLTSENCMSVEVGTNKTAKVFRNFGAVKDFSKFPNGQLLSPQDWFVIDVKVSNVTSLDSIELKFFNDPSGQQSTTSEATNLSALSVTLVPDDALVNQLATGANGLGDIPEIADDETSFLMTPPNAASGTSKTIIERLGTMRLGAEGQWMRLRIPRSSFTYSNSTAIGLKNGWETVTAFEIIITTNKEEDNVIARFDNGGFVGGVGMQGKYKYCYTLKDPNTLHRSNPSPIVEVDAPFRWGTALNLPLAPLSDTDKNTRGQITSLFLHTGAGLIREIWRTMGNGAQFFKCGEIPAGNNDVILVYDNVADFRGMRNLEPAVSGIGGTAKWIMNGFLDPTEVLQFDNIAPSHGFMDCFGLAYGRLFWTRDETPDPNDATNFPGKGRLYFSPAGRLESVESFINVTHGGDDATQKGVIWNGIYVFSQRRCFEILGTDVPFSAREILGVPGTLWPYTVVPTPYGIVYEAMDGLRVFDGSSSTLLPMEPVAPFFRRDTKAQQDAGFSTLQTSVNHIACFVSDEYRWSDGTTFLAFNLRTGVWRQVSAAQSNFPTALYVEPVFGECYGGRVGGISSLEFGSIGGDYTTSSGTTTAIAYEFETPGWLVDGRPTFYVQRLYVDATIRSGETMTVALCTEDGAPGVGPTATTIGTISGTGSRKLYEVNVGCQYVAVASVRLTGSTTSTGTTRIHGVEMDVHVPEEPGFGT